MDNLVMLITTNGCEACHIAKRLIEKAISCVEIDIRFEIVDCLDPYYWNFIKENNVTDYPTTLYIVDDIVKDKTIGTRTVYNIVKKLNKVFK